MKCENKNALLGILSVLLVSMVYGVEWDAYYDTPGWNRGGQSIDATTDLGYIIASYTNIEGLNFAGVLTKIDAWGNRQWERIYYDSPKTYLFSVKQTSDGGYIVVGAISIAGGYDVFLLKTDTIGVEEWSISIDVIDVFPPRDDFGNAVIEDSDGNFVVTGTSADVSIPDRKLFLLKCSAHGHHAWSRIDEGAGTNRRGWDVIETVDEEYVVAGAKSIISIGYWDTYMIKYSKDGSWIRHQTINLSSEDDMVLSVKEAENGYIFAGFAFQNGTCKATLIKTDESFRAFDPYGWAEYYGDGVWAQEVAARPDGGYSFVGHQPPWGLYIYYVETDMNGDVQQEKFYNDGQTGCSMTINKLYPDMDNGYTLTGRYTSPCVYVVCNYDDAPPKYIVQTDNVQTTAFNNGAKSVKCGNDIYFTYTSGIWGEASRKIYILKSTDNGASFTEVFNSFGQAHYVSQPSITTDNSGNPYVIWGDIYRNGPGGSDEPWGWYRRYYCTYLDNGDWIISDAIISDKVYDNQVWTPPSDSLPAPSIAASIDSGYIAYKPLGSSDIKIARFLLADPAINEDEIVTNSDCAECYVPIGYDTGGRLVLIEFDWDSGVLKLHYRGIGGSWNCSIIEDVEAAGSPSLWTGFNEIRVVCEGGNGLMCTHYYWNPFSKPAKYVQQFYECITYYTDWPLYQEGYSYLASKDVVLWRYNDDIMYSMRMAPDIWAEPTNVSHTPKEYSCYPTGLVYNDFGGNRLLSIWSEKSCGDYYATVDTITLPDPGDKKDQNRNNIVKNTANTIAPQNMYLDPTQNIMNIQFISSHQHNATVKLYDITGRSAGNIYSGKVHNGLNQITYNVGNLPSGIYFLRCEVGDEVFTEKVVIRR